MLWLVLALLLAGCASGPARPPGGVRAGDTRYLAERLEYEANELRQEHGLPSLALSLVDEHGPVFERAWGLSDVRHRVPSSIDTPYRWGSNAKLFVMLSLLQLEARGLVDLDAPLRSYLPELELRPPPRHHPETATWNPEQVTLRRMLTHSSGLPNEYLPGFMSERPLEMHEVLERVRTMHVAFPVDVVHSYSNLAYGLLGVVVERASQRPFATYVDEHLFTPLAMDGAAFTWDEQLAQRVARGHDGRGRELPLYRISLAPAGELTASTREMGKFATAILAGGRGVRGRVVETQALLASFQRQDGGVALAFDDNQALTWLRDARFAEIYGPSVQHGGGLPGHHSAFTLLTGHRLGVAVVTNSDRGAGLVNHLAWRALSLAIEAKTGREPQPQPPLRVEARSAFAAGELERWLGHYTTPFGDLEIRDEGQRLLVDAFGRELELKPVVAGGVGIFASFLGLWDVQPDPFAELRLSRVDVGPRKVVVQDWRTRRHLLATAYEPIPASQRWRARIGFYRVVPREGDFQFLSGMELHLGTAGQLALRPHLLEPGQEVPGSAALHPLDDQQAVTEGLGRNRGVRIVFDALGRLHLSGLVFERAPLPRQSRPAPRLRVAPRGANGVTWH